MEFVDNIKIKSIRVIINDGASDKVCLHTEMLDGMYPHTDKLTLYFQTAKGTASEYCAKNFPKTPVMVFDAGGNKPTA